ncbi:pimeloyl-ACP methyl ester carboxylesterase [Sphingobium sp. OAS761]|uniref:alpha/beta fold hydrolase n=1 Tax=Sphingobium sp. OAS761 TaxID=2817901 RepID=UPI00209FDE03|nr:alpha/beta hydrolase [Sphingobium sp. OAS761]MCP1469041.1 pimeloyl-ACP methyl ester carboxylesterase [Sphingobium sp. OAS761]
MNKVKSIQVPVAEDIALTIDVGGQAGAPTIVLLHGGGQTRHSWADAVSYLIARGYRVMNIDARGHGESDWSPDGRYRLEDLADDLAAVLATVDGPVALVGASLGGLTGLCAVGQGLVPNVRALVLVDITLSPVEAGIRRIVAFMTANEGGFATPEQASDAIATYNPARGRPASTKGLAKVLRKRSDGRYHWHWDPAFLRQPAEGRPWTMAAVSAAPNVGIPTLVIRGMDSDIVDDAGVAELAATIPQVEVREIAGAGHMVVGDRNDAFMGAMADFLAQTFPSEPDRAGHMDD